ISNKKIIATKIQECYFPPLKIRSYLLDNKQKIERELIYENFPIPTLKQIQGFAAKFKNNNGTNNSIEPVVEYIRKHEFRSDMVDDEIFYFSLSYYESGNQIVKPASESNHLNLVYTTKKLLIFLDDKVSFSSIFDIDATYKITKNGFPLVVFGRSDIHLQFIQSHLCS
ncbi:unnamed protein product, partial [Brachionus calyciflorus]